VHVAAPFFEIVVDRPHKIVGESTDLITVAASHEEKQNLK